MKVRLLPRLSNFDSEMAKFSRFLIGAFSAVTLFGVAASCSDDDPWVDYESWRNDNVNWLNEQIATGLYEKVTPVWNDSIYVYMRWLNDTTLTSGNLVPYYTSEVEICYKGMFYNGVGFDSTYLLTDSVTTLIPKNVITGWTIALERMHVGDRAHVLIPYQVGYGTSGSGIIPPYSTLQFDMDLRNITALEIRP